GESLTLNLYGCADGAAAPLWSGASQDLAVTANEKTGRRIYFTRKDAASCAGAAGQIATSFSDTLSQPRAMHASVVTAEGNVLIVGGFTAFSGDSDSSPILTGGDQSVSSITEYRPSRGLFAEWSSVWNSRLAVPRGMPHVVALDGGKKALVIGGITRAAIVSAGEPPLLPKAKTDESVLASPAIEVLDTQARTVQPGNLGLGPLAYSALTHSPDGTTIVLSGGRLDNGEPSNKLQFVRGTAAELTGGTATVTTKGDALPIARMGHSATWLKDNTVLLLGGAVSDDNTQLAELLSGDSFDATPITITSAPDDMPSMALHQTALISTSDDGCTSRLLVVGGMGLTSAGKPIWIPAVNGPARLYTMVVDSCQNPPTAVIAASDALGTGARSRRVLHQLTDLGEGLFMVSGGVHQLTSIDDPDCAGDTASGCYLADMTILKVDDNLQVTQHKTLQYQQAGGVARPRIGHHTSVLPDGSVLTTGGLNATSTTTGELARAPELFNTLKPSEATICQ
ncbi:MAG: hypothetical protein ACI9OJ_000526, partial [Myxococcota bacterium]